jgi:8-oxo-dGTP diphosphatase
MEETEYWDLYDKDGSALNKTHKRGDKLSPGEYHLVVSNWIRDDQDRYLIQKRNKPLKDIHNPWSCTAGAVIQGESSIEAVQRETLEEMGLDFNRDNFKFMERMKFGCFIMDVYESIWDGRSEDIIFDPVEVEDVKWLTASEMIEMYNNKIFIDHGTNYFNNIINETNND